ncbi:MAG: hypothetical protein ACRDTZ_05370 [Pseudonocardiaceae bacterium]
MHAPDMAHPMPVLTAAWKPRLVTCHGCGHLFRFPRNSVSDRTCDGCGTVVDVGTVIWTGAVGAGALTYLFGVCEDCRFWDA